MKERKIFISIGYYKLYLMPKVLIVYKTKDERERAAVEKILEEAKRKPSYRLKRFSDNCIILHSAQISMQLLRRIKNAMPKGKLLYVQIEDHMLRVM
mgnify:CR=1 FL=1